MADEKSKTQVSKSEFYLTVGMAYLFIGSSIGISAGAGDGLSRLFAALGSLAAVGLGVFYIVAAFFAKSKEST